MTVKKGIYKHYKNKLYELVDVATHTENDEEFVVYKALYDIPGKKKNALWLRPKDMFFENIIIDNVEHPRFEYIGDKKHEAL